MNPNLRIGLFISLLSIGFCARIAADDPPGFVWSGHGSTSSGPSYFDFNSPGNIYSDGISAGQQAGRGLRREINSPDKINSKFSEPITDNNRLMTTFGPDTAASSGTACPDGYTYDYSSSICRNQGFDAQLTAPSSGSFLKIFIATGNTNDLDTITIQRDTDFDGTVEHTYTSPFRASGICADGIISCIRGTWQNCRYFRWRANPGNLHVYLWEVPEIGNLAGCYCINTSCGSTLVATNMASILADLGGGIVGSVQNADPHVAVTNVTTTASSIEYFGQRSSAAGSGFPSGGSPPYYNGNPQPESYFNATSDTLTEAGLTEMTSQTGDNSSFLHAMMDTHNQILNSKETRTCAITRSIGIDAADNPDLTTTDSCRSLDVTGCTLYEETICDYTKSNCVNSYEETNPTGLIPAVNTYSMVSPNTGDTWGFDSDGNRITFSNPLVANGIVSAGPDHWWNLQRVYLCESAYDINTKNYPLDEPDPAFIGNEGVDRTYHVQTNVSQVDSTIFYEDYDPSSGDIASHTFQLQPMGALPGCEQACKVRIETTKTDVGQTANAWQYQSDVSSLEINYKSCQDGGCPLESGETILQDCTCLNELPEVVSVMQAMKDAGEDMICAPR